MVDISVSTNENVKKTTIIDILKFVCCFLVVCIHTKPFQNIFWLDAGVGLVTRIAVPYFFITSAYFLMLKNGKDFWKGILNLIILYSFWYVLSLALSKSTYSNANSFGWWVNVVRNYFWLTNGNPLWFVCALIWADVAVYALRKILSPKILLVIGVVMFLIGYFFSTAYSITSKIPVVKEINDTIISKIGTQNALFFAFPYVAIANFILTDNYCPSPKKSLTLWVMFWVALSIEAIIMVKILNSTLNYLWLFAMPMTYFAFKFSSGVYVKDRKIYFALRKLSAGVYLVHPIILEYVRCGLNALRLSDNANIMLTIVVFLISLLIAFLLFTLSNVKRLKFIKKII